MAALLGGLICALLVKDPARTMDQLCGSIRERLRQKNSRYVETRYAFAMYYLTMQHLSSMGTGIAVDDVVDGECKRACASAEGAKVLWLLSVSDAMTEFSSSSLMRLEGSLHSLGLTALLG